MHVEPEHVPEAVQRPPAVDQRVLLERLVHRHRQHAQVRQPLGQHPHARPVDLLELRARLDDVHARLLGGVHDVVHLPLQRRELAAHRERAGDVGGVEVVVLHAHVHEDQLAGPGAPVVGDPVQRRRVRPGPDDGVVADPVALHARPHPEHAFEQALGDRAGRRQHPGHVLEAADGRVDRVLELRQLPGVLGQPQLGEHRRQLAVARQRRPLGPLGREAGVDRRIEAAQHAHLRAVQAVEHRVEPFDVAALDPQQRRGLVQRVLAPDPQLPVLRRAEELVGVGALPRAAVQHRVVARAARVQHQHALGVEVPGQPREVRAGPETEVRVVRAHLLGAGGDDDRLTGERRRDRRAPPGAVRRLIPLGDIEIRRAPARAHELQELLGELRVVRPLAGSLLSHRRSFSSARVSSVPPDRTPVPGPQMRSCRVCVARAPRLT